MATKEKREIQVGDTVKWIHLGVAHRGIVHSVKPGRTAIVVEKTPRNGKIYSPWLSRLKVVRRAKAVVNSTAS